MHDDPSHPSAEQLCAFSLGRVSDAELAGISAHLAACRGCCDLLDQLAARDGLLSRLQEAATRPDAVPEEAAQRRAASRVLRQGLLRAPSPSGSPAPEPLPPRQIGTHDGQPFLALEWVEGGSLAERLDGKPWPTDEAIRLVETLAGAIHAAHSQGVVHRDLKPANILLSFRTDFTTGEPGASAPGGMKTPGLTPPARQY
jgi:hypothetical protein